MKFIKLTAARGDRPYPLYLQASSISSGWRVGDCTCLRATRSQHLVTETCEQIATRMAKIDIAFVEMCSRDDTSNWAIWLAPEHIVRLTSLRGDKHVEITMEDGIAYVVDDNIDGVFHAVGKRVDLNVI